MRRMVEGTLKLRVRVLRLFPTRRTPRLRTAIKHRTYPKGYRIEELGPKEAAHASPYLRKRGHEAEVESGVGQPESVEVVT